MAHSPEQMRKKEMAQEEAERHHVYANVEGMRESANAGYKREQSERRNNPEMYDEQGYARMK